MLVESGSSQLSFPVPSLLCSAPTLPLPLELDRTDLAPSPHRSFLFHYILPHFTSLAGFASSEGGAVGKRELEHMMSSCCPYCYSPLSLLLISYSASLLPMGYSGANVTCATPPTQGEMGREDGGGIARLALASSRRRAAPLRWSRGSFRPRPRPPDRMSYALRSPFSSDQCGKRM